MNIDNRLDELNVDILPALKDGVFRVVDNAIIEYEAKSNPEKAKLTAP